MGMKSCMLLTIIFFSGLCVTESATGDVEGPRKKVTDLYYAGFISVIALVFIKLKLAFIAWLLFTGTATTTKFIAALFRYLGHNCKEHPVYLKQLKYESPSYENYEHYQTPDKQYYKEQDTYYYGKYQ